MKSDYSSLPSNPRLWPPFCSLGYNNLDLDTVKMICELLKTNTTITSLG